MLRPATAEDLRLLEDLLVEAAYWDGRPRPGRAEALAPLARYLEGWPRPGDAGAVVEEPPGRPIGGGWYRLLPAAEPGYGFVDERTPELGVAVLEGHRGREVGHELVSWLLGRAAADGHDRLSLSVEEGNAMARALYRRHGFVEAARAGGAITMVAATAPGARPAEPSVRPRTPADLEQPRLRDGGWGETVVSRGRVHRVAELPGWVAEVDGRPAGLLTAQPSPQAWEVVTVDAFVPGRGVGTALLRAARHAARAAGATRLWLITTNDNTSALRFYQRRGWDLVALHRDALTASRAFKPSIPQLGADAIAIRHELELERLLEPWLRPDRRPVRGPGRGPRRRPPPPRR